VLEQGISHTRMLVGCRGSHNNKKIKSFWEHRGWCQHRDIRWNFTWCLCG